MLKKKSKKRKNKTKDQKLKTFRSSWSSPFYYKKVPKGLFYNKKERFLRKNYLEKTAILYF
jgi:hypothetical protein